jgi:hypothetical protein
MLTDAPIVWRWMSGNMSSQSAGLDGDLITGSREEPAPLNLGILDARDLLADQLAELVDDVCETRNLTGPKRHTVEADAKFVLTWLGTVEREDWIGDWWTALAETMSACHKLAPWRPEMRRCYGIACPECEETNLVVFGGDEDVTCLSCRTMIPPDRYLIWTRILADGVSA